MNYSTNPQIIIYTWHIPLQQPMLSHESSESASTSECGKKNCILYEVINIVNLEVHVEVYLSCLVYIDDPYVFFLYRSYFL